MSISRSKFFRSFKFLKISWNLFQKYGIKKAIVVAILFEFLVTITKNQLKMIYNMKHTVYINYTDWMKRFNAFPYVDLNVLHVKLYIVWLINDGTTDPIIRPLSFELIRFFACRWTYWRTMLSYWLVVSELKLNCISYFLNEVTQITVVITNWVISYVSVADHSLENQNVKWRQMITTFSIRSFKNYASHWKNKTVSISII